MKNIKQALPLVDVVKFYDNSYYARPYIDVAQLTAGILTQSEDALPDWATRMLEEYLS